VKADYSEEENPATPPLASPEADRATAIISCLNVLVLAPLREDPKAFPWSYCGPADTLLSTMKACWTAPGLPDDADALVRFLRSDENYKRLRAAGLLVTFPKNPQSGPGRERPDLVRVERETNQEAYVPLIDGVRR
jgi:hypothetical protein